MKSFLLVLALGATLAAARPRFLIIPLDDVEFAHHRVSRAAWPQDDQEFRRPGPGGNRREDLPPGGPPSGGFAIPSALRGDPIAQGR